MTTDHGSSLELITHAPSPLAASREFAIDAFFLVKPHEVLGLTSSHTSHLWSVGPVGRQESGRTLIHLTQQQQRPLGGVADPWRRCRWSSGDLGRSQRAPLLVVSDPRGLELLPTHSCPCAQLCQETGREDGRRGSNPGWDWPQYSKTPLIL